MPIAFVKDRHVYQLNYASSFSKCDIFLFADTFKEDVVCLYPVNEGKDVSFH